MCYRMLHISSNYTSACVQIIGVDPEGSLMAQPDSLNPRQFQPYELEVSLSSYDSIPV